MAEKGDDQEHHFLFHPLASLAKYIQGDTLQMTDVFLYNGLSLSLLSMLNHNYILFCYSGM